MTEPIKKATRKMIPLPDHILLGALDVWGASGEQHFIPVSGSSMLPLIQDGDQALVIHGVTGIRRGDMVVFRQQGKMVVHRVLRVNLQTNSPTFLIKGDNNLSVDPPVQAEEIVGRVLLIKRGEKTLAIDTYPWRMVGRAIAWGTLAGFWLYRWGGSLKRRWLGTQSNSLTRFLRRAWQTSASFILGLFKWLLSGR
jgi:signal peptidase I